MPEATLLHTALHHPQRLWLRRALFQVHLWAGILAALYLTVVGLTGSILVFEDELAAQLLPRPSSAALRAVQTGQTGPLAPLVASASPVTFVQTPTAETPFYRLTVRDASGRYVTRLADAATAQLLPPQPRNWLQWVHDLHIFLLAGPTGLLVNGCGAALLLVLALTGLVLWWQGLARWTRGLTVRLRSGWRRINFDLHLAFGFWTILWLLWWGVSSVYFAWPRQVASLVNAVSPLDAMHPPAPPPAVRAPALPLDTLLARARAGQPGLFLSGFAPSPASLTVYFDTAAPGDFSHRDIVTYALSGRRLATWHYGRNRTPGDWFLWAMHPLHFGTLWGLPCKILWALAGLSLPLLSVTGLLMYWNRKLRHLLRRTHAPQPLPTSPQTMAAPGA